MEPHSWRDGRDDLGDPTSQVVAVAQRVFQHQVRSRNASDPVGHREDDRQPTCGAIPVCHRLVNPGALAVKSFPRTRHKRMAERAGTRKSCLHRNEEKFTSNEVTARFL